MNSPAFRIALREVANMNQSPEQIATECFWDAAKEARQHKIKLNQFTTTMEMIFALAENHANCTDARHLNDAIRDIRDMALARLCGVQ